MEKPNSKIDFQSQETGRPEKLPPLHEEDGSRNISNRFSFSTGYCQLDKLFQDTASPVCSYADKLQELADIEAQYSELIKPWKQTHDAVRFKPGDEGKLSTDEIIRFGSERFIQSRSSDPANVISTSAHPYAGKFLDLSEQEVKDIQLIENLLLSSEKVNQQQFDRARKLLDWCDSLCSSSGNPIQRIVYYFSKALREKIDGVNPHSESGKKHAYNIPWRIMNPNMCVVSIYQKLPFFQAAHFSGVQALVDHLSGSKRVHVIDLAIRQGVHTTILMQALASQPGFRIKHLRITAVGTGFAPQVKQTGDRLKSFADSINLPLSFNMVIVEDLLDFNKDVLQLNPTEALGVFSSYGLWSLIAQQDRLESLMKVIKSASPRVMVVCEVAANLNAPNFVNRLTEALFHYGALFDSLEYHMDRDDEDRGIIECMYLGEGIRSIVGTEGVERVVRHVNIDVWRKFFMRFGMKEIGFSMSSLYQAKLVVGSFSSGSCCTLETNGESVIIGWKGAPITCVSAWEFS